MIVLLTLSTAVALSATSYVCLCRKVRRNHPEIFRPEIFRPEIFRPEIFRPEIFRPETFRSPATIAPLRLLVRPRLEATRP